MKLRRGRDVIDAAIVHIERPDDGATRHVRVELSRSAASERIALDPREAVVDFLDEESPPTHLLVTAQGVEVLESPPSSRQKRRFRNA